jgi:hypothetical protein
VFIPPYTVHRSASQGHQDLVDFDGNLALLPLVYMYLSVQRVPLPKPRLLYFYDIDRVHVESPHVRSELFLEVEVRRMRGVS